MFKSVYENIFTPDEIQELLEEFGKKPARSQLKRLPIDAVAEWKIGNVITWHKDQLHCSTNFAKYNLRKKMIVIFIA